jgi:hypothetical protein
LFLGLTSCIPEISSYFLMTSLPPRQRKVANMVRPVPDAVITVYVCS